MRYRLYRVHKYVCYELSEFDKATAKVDFSNNQAIEQLKEKFKNLVMLLESHAAYEDKTIHELLRQKNSQIQAKIEEEHHEQEERLALLKKQLNSIAMMEDKNDKILQGYDFYLLFRLFYADMLKHLYDEEKTILPLLQELYSDEELASSQAKSYAKMTTEDMLHMAQALFPHFNAEDRLFFMTEMKIAEPEKFNMIASQLSTADKN